MVSLRVIGALLFFSTALAAPYEYQQLEARDDKKVSTTTTTTTAVTTKPAST